MSTDSRKRKHKSNYYKQNNKRKYGGEELKSQCKGFLISCGGNEQRTISEAYNILNEYADKIYGPEKFIENDSESVAEEAKDSEDEDIEDLLKKEVENIKKNSSKDTIRRFQSVNTKCKNVVFIKTTLENPGELVDHIFNDILDKKAGKTRHCLRFLPVIETCYAKHETIMNTASEVIKTSFGAMKESVSFCIMWKSRCNNTVKRQECVAEIADEILACEQDHSVNYDKPDVILNIDIVGNICCFGILKNYQKFKKYNISALLDVVHMATEKIGNKKKIEKDETKDSQKIENVLTDDCEKEKLIDNSKENDSIKNEVQENAGKNIV